MARIFNLLVYIVCIYVAIRLIPAGKKIMLLVGLLPMSLYLAASVSADAVIISFSLLAIALIINICTFKLEASTKFKLATAFILICVLALTKNSYALFSLLFIFVPVKYFSNKKFALLIKILSIIVPIILAVAWGSMILDVAQSIHTVFKPTEYISSGQQLAGILSNPFRFIGVILNTILLKSGSLITMSFIGIFGWLDMVLPFFCYLLSLWIMFITILYEGANTTVKQKPSLRDRRGFAIIGLLISLTILTSLYLGYSALNSSYVDGVQGRYFIPILPLLIPLLIRKNKFIRISEKRINLLISISILILLTMTAFTIVNANIFRINY